MACAITENFDYFFAMSESQPGLPKSQLRRVKYGSNPADFSFRRTTIESLEQDFVAGTILTVQSVFQNLLGCSRYSLVRKFYRVPTVKLAVKTFLTQLNSKNSKNFTAQYRVPIEIEMVKRRQ